MANGVGWQDAGSCSAWFGPSRDRFLGLLGSGKHRRFLFEFLCELEKWKSPINWVRGTEWQGQLKAVHGSELSFERKPCGLQERSQEVRLKVIVARPCGTATVR
jgi:hypothetical protein